MNTARPNPIPLPIPAAEIVDVGDGGELISSDGLVYVRRVVDGVESWSADPVLSSPKDLRWVALRSHRHGKGVPLSTIVATNFDGRTFWFGVNGELGYAWFEGWMFDRSAPYCCTTDLDDNLAWVVMTSQTTPMTATADVAEMSS